MTFGYDTHCYSLCWTVKWNKHYANQDNITLAAPEKLAKSWAQISSTRQPDLFNFSEVSHAQPCFTLTSPLPSMYLSSFLSIIKWQSFFPVKSHSFFYHNQYGWTRQWEPVTEPAEPNGGNETDDMDDDEADDGGYEAENQNLVQWRPKQQENKIHWQRCHQRSMWQIPPLPPFTPLQLPPWKYYAPERYDRQSPSGLSQFLFQCHS